MQVEQGVINELILQRAAMPPFFQASSPEGVVRNAFYTAVLLTGSVARAEAAVTYALERWNPEEMAGQFRSAARKAALAGGSAVSPEEREPAATLFPLTLRRVLRLPTPLRQCYVLRILNGLGTEACSSLLHLSICQVNEYTSAALLQLSPPAAGVHPSNF